jgi:hypothetical protein
MTLTAETYEERKQQLGSATDAALAEFERAKATLATLHKESLRLEAQWAVAEVRANATPGMWPSGQNDPLMVSAAQVLTDAGYKPALVGGSDIRDCQDTGFFLPRRNRDEPVEVWHLVDGRNRQSNGVDAWYEQLNAYRDVFRAAGWRIEWQSDVRSIRVAPPVDRADGAADMST